MQKPPEQPPNPARGKRSLQYSTADRTEKRIRTSINSFGSPSTANRHHLANPGSIPANRTLLSGMSPRRPSSVPMVLSKNTFFSRPLNNSSVAWSRQTSMTRCRFDEARCVRVSDRRAWKVESGAAAIRDGIPPCVRTCCNVSDVGGNRVDMKLQIC